MHTSSSHKGETIAQGGNSYGERQLGLGSLLTSVIMYTSTSARRLQPLQNTDMGLSSTRR
jgi:hypothetical protein